MFLHHPKVPEWIKQSQSDMINTQQFVNKQELDENSTNLLLNGMKQFDTYSVIHLINIHTVEIMKNSSLWSLFSTI